MLYRNHGYSKKFALLLFRVLEVQSIAIVILKKESLLDNKDIR